MSGGFWHFVNEEGEGFEHARTTDDALTVIESIRNDKCGSLESRCHSTLSVL